MTAPCSRRTTRRRAHRQRGAALLTAMIIVTLVTTLAASMIWQQWRAVQVEAAERGRVQAAWILSGALDFASLILVEDLRSRRPTALTEPWATPLAESRLSTFLAVDAANADDGPEAFLSGNIQDAQGKFNLRNLLDASFEMDPAQVKALESLCETVGVETGVASRIATGLRAALASGTSTGVDAAAPLQPRTIAQLSWLGIDPAALKALEPYVSLLPDITKLNVNTASREVLAAVMGVDLATSESLLQVRQRAPFKDVPTLAAQLPGQQLDVDKLDVRSNYFEVSGRLRLSDRVLVEHSLVQRNPQTRKVNVLQRERVSSLEQVGG